jgi:type VI secretion system protein VasG
MSVNLRALIGRLNHETRSAVEGAAGLCLSRTNYDVEVDHYLMKALDATDTDLAYILKQYGVDRARLATGLTASVDRLKTGNARTPSLSPSLVKMLSEAWMVGSVDFGAQQIRTGHTILALLRNPELQRLVTSISPEFEKISLEDLGKQFGTIVGASVEETPATTWTGPVEGAPAGAPVAGKTANLDQFTHDLTGRAREGKIDPVLGRDFEIRQVVDILTRRRQNNPILVGEAGVGKTAVVEGFARRIVEGDVPDVLKNITVRTLDLALLQAGAGIKGEFENRLKGLIDEVKSSPSPIILFIDEAHTMIGAGGAAGQSDAANLLKPALARGELRTVAATTWSEYKKYFEKDPALARRFQLVKVEEPSEEVCNVMMRGVVPALEAHHGVRILDEGMNAAVRLSHRYLADRHLPDKAVSVLDTACARLALGQSATPAPVENATRRLQDLALQKRVLQREMALGVDHGDRLEEIERLTVETEEELALLKERWEQESALVAKVRDLRRRIEQLVHGDGDSDASSAEAAGGDDEAAQAAESSGDPGHGDPGDSNTGDPDPGPNPEGVNPESGNPGDELPSDPGEGAVAAAAEPAQEAGEPPADSEPAEAEADPDALRNELEALMAELEAVQGEDPLVPVSVDAELVGQVISGWTGIPVGKMMRDEMESVLSLEQHLGERIIGQDHALVAISRRIRTSKAGIEDPSKPIGVFMLVGPSGVGKTETALVLSDLLYGGEHNVVTINMSEFQEAHTVSTLKGSPPGYVGYGEGGVLTEAVRRRPYSIVLLDEVEKAHPDVLELFFQVFDKGRMEDGEGRQIDFKNTIIMLTTNAGTDTIMKLTSDPETMPDSAGLAKVLKPELNKTFKPAFLGRLVIIPYFPLPDEAMKKIVVLKLNKIRRRMEESHGVKLVYDEVLVNEVAARCTEVESGARNIDNILTNTLLPELSRSILGSLVEGDLPAEMQVSVGEDGSFVYTAGPGRGAGGVE